jgi:hypothetical protein
MTDSPSSPSSLRKASSPKGETPPSNMDIPQDPDADPAVSAPAPELPVVSEPTLAVSEPILAVSEPILAVSEPTLTVSEPTLAVSEPTLAFSEPTLAVSEPTLAVSDAVVIQTPTNPTASVRASCLLYKVFLVVFLNRVWSPTRCWLRLPGIRNLGTQKTQQRNIPR